jgi:hypothetical protein
MARRHHVRKRNARRRLAKLRYFGEGAIDRSLTATAIGHDAGDRPAVARNDERLATLDVVEQTSQMRFGLGRLDFSHILPWIN